MTLRCELRGSKELHTRRGSKYKEEMFMIFDSIVKVRPVDFTGIGTLLEPLGCLLGIATTGSLDSPS